MIARPSSTSAPVLVWFRQDLRLDDNPALEAARSSGQPVILLFVLDDDASGKWTLGGASRWWLHHSLAALDEALKGHGGRLLLRRGSAAEIVPALCAQHNVSSVFWNRVYEPHAISRDTRLKASLKKAGVAVKSFASALLVEPMAITTQTGEAYKVYSAFWRACLRGEALRVAERTRIPEQWANVAGGDELSSWGLLPHKPNWAKGFEPLWLPGEAGAHAALDHFLEASLGSYAGGRDFLGEAHTSRLSPHLRWGEISPSRVLARVETHAAAEPTHRKSADKFISELGWREFSYYLLYHWPNLPEANWRSAFDRLRWRDDEAGFVAWSKGLTGYPVVDAGMRELWATGTMHNRARMVTASFLVKHLLIDWRKGADWFWDTLLDADLANNSASWQWVAGCGADAAPYFRIFNPVTQGEKFDADGVYVRKWVPEIAALPNKLLHQPWSADNVTLKGAGVRLGVDYPAPITPHQEARERALAAYAKYVTS